jgi:hypothetical protein
MKPKDRLARTTTALIRQILTDRNVGWENGIQHGGGTINTEAIVCGELSLAITLSGKIEICDESGEHVLLKHNQTETALKILEKGGLLH